MDILHEETPSILVIGLIGRYIIITGIVTVITVVNIFLIPSNTLFRDYGYTCS